LKIFSIGSDELKITSKYLNIQTFETFEIERSFQSNPEEAEFFYIRIV